MNKTLILAIVVVMFANCKSTKTTIDTTKETEKDSTYIEKTTQIVKPFKYNLELANPCIEGKLTAFNYVIATPQGNINIKNENDTLKGTIDLESLKSVWEKEYKANHKDKVQVIKDYKRIYKTPFNMWVILVLSLLLNITFLYLIFKRR